MAEVIPSDYQILMDANSSFGSPGRTLDVAKELRRFPQMKAFENPIPHEDTGGYRRLRQDLPIRLAVHWEAVDVRTYMVEALVDSYVVEDWRWGPALAEKSELCTLTGQTLWVENGLFTGISQAFQAQCAAAHPNIEYTISLTHIAEDDIVVEPFVVERGLHTVSQKPGLGVTLDGKALEKYRVV
jgi:L-alanine-DL-glutamate epimerase-like enolase superfamily enzyme